MKLGSLSLGVLLLASISWFFWSFTQVDLNLTLIRFEPFFSWIDALKMIGVFQRPTATGWFVITWLGLWIGYFGLVYHFNFAKAQFGKLIKVLLIVSFVITLSYPATSYDLFNYMFDAKIVTEYAANPYTSTAQDFPDDEWVRFMHWTHRTYPYGPAWLGLTVPLVYLGSNVWILTYGLFKLLMLASYLVMARAIYLLGRRLGSIDFANKVTVAFMAHPLILVEGLSAAHLDLVMAALSMVGVLLVARSKLWGFGMLILGGLVKFVTLAWLPAFLLPQLSLKFKLELALLMGLFLTGMVMLQREVLPWYMIPSLGLMLLVSHRASELLWWLLPGLSIRYALLYWHGEYSQLHLDQRASLTTTLLLLGCLGFVVRRKLLEYKTSR